MATTPGAASKQIHFKPGDEVRDVKALRASSVDMGMTELCPCYSVLSSNFSIKQARALIHEANNLTPQDTLSIPRFETVGTDEEWIRYTYFIEKDLGVLNTLHNASVQERLNALATGRQEPTPDQGTVNEAAQWALGPQEGQQGKPTRTLADLRAQDLPQHVKDVLESFVKRVAPGTLPPASGASASAGPADPLPLRVAQAALGGGGAGSNQPRTAGTLLSGATYVPRRPSTPPQRTLLNRTCRSCRLRPFCKVTRAYATSRPTP